MTGFCMLHPSARGLILMVLYLLMLLQFGCLLAVLGGTGRELVKSIVPLFLLFVLEVVFLRCANEMLEADSGFPVVGGWDWLCRFPAEIIGILMVLEGICTGCFLKRTMEAYRKALNRSSIKESIDNLPSGLSFSTPEGFVLLANRRMEALCYSIAGMDFQDANHFWQILQEGRSAAGVECLSDKTAPSFRLPDQTVWAFERKILQVEGVSVVQITAADITELQNLSARLQENNRELAETNRRLLEYGEKMGELVRSRKVLETKTQIHNEMGRALLLTRAYLKQDGQTRNEQEIRAYWKYIIALLKKETEPRMPVGMWDSFRKAAAAAGVKVFVEGDVPEGEETEALAAAAAAEALTNAVRHAGADELYVEFSEMEDSVRAVFRNNGRNPKGKIKEGGGLSSLRLRLEEAGGAMQTEAGPGFALQITIPDRKRIER